MDKNFKKPKPISNQEGNPSTSTTPLLSPETYNSSTPPPNPAAAATTAAFIFMSILIAAFLALSTIGIPSAPIHLAANAESPHPPLKHPVVIMISADGFRFGYQFKTKTPNIHRLIKGGVEARQGLIPVFPTATFPNHYAIATGLYPAHHGIISNNFFDPNLNESFRRGDNNPKWWLGEPLWETVVNDGRYNASTYFWPGSEVVKGKWKCEEYFCKRFNMTVTFEERVDTVLEYFNTSDTGTIPAFMTLYFQDPDSQGHEVGPDDLEITEAVARIDAMVGRLIRGLEEREVFNQVNIILLGDHGMAGVCDKKVIFLDDLKDQGIEIRKEWVIFDYSVLGIFPPRDFNLTPTEIVARMNKGLEKIENGKHLKVYVKEKLPTRLHYSGSDRIPPIIGLVDEGYTVTQSGPAGKEYCGGTHGYDNAYFSMRSIFVGHGPHFKKGVKVESFVNVEIYNVVTSILNIRGAPNNGTKGFPDQVLSYHHPVEEG
ncbi:uncharacterized protein LOC130792802 [Actinidia eriantha]|uniref:uncharacterized protein LOC130792802 n=1 Tax=Actinidia eriantha TaxID=165200 RepID=UPI0025880141|nr:uncharacterized protein LOC130792802 [Actinidia eriantha]